MQCSTARLRNCGLPNVAIGEFALIDRFFAAAGGEGRDDVILGIGDDAALVRVPAGHELVVAADTIVAGAHFPREFPAEAIGYRALAVNLSDMAAMGAAPAWYTLALTLPSADERWLADFSRGLHGLAARHGVALIGGDTTAGPLTVTVQILGLVPAGSAIRRSGARTGDLVCVSGTVGDAAAGLRALEDSARGSSADREFLIERFIHPVPRVELGLMLRGVATAAIDVSDGLYADAEKMLAAGGVGARLDLDVLPISDALRRYAGEEGARPLALQGGDDYELCFTLPAAQFPAFEAAARAAGQVIHSIGVVESDPGVRCQAAGRAIDLKLTGYDHFSS